MGCLYYTLYGNTNCQAEIGSGTDNYTKATGQTDALGMEDTKASTNSNTQSINFWGLENWWGNKFEWIDDYVNPANDLTATVNYPVNGGTRNLGIPSSGYTGYYVKKMKFGRHLDLVATDDDPKSSDNLTGYSDYQWWPDSTASSTRSIRRSGNNSGVACGVSYARASAASVQGSTYNGSRIAFRGASTEAENVEAFKRLPVL